MISDTIFRRSVLKNIKSDKNICIRPVNAAGDAVVMHDGTAMSVKSGDNAVIAACNALVCVGAKVQAVNTSIMLPQDFDEKYLKQFIKRLGSQCELFGAVLGDVAVNIINKAGEELLTASAVGRCCESVGDAAYNNTDIVAVDNTDIVAVGSIGLSGIRSVLEKYRGEAARFYTDSFIEKANVSDEELSVSEIAEIALKSGAEYLHAAGDGGIFAALWRLAEEIHSGIDIDFRNIPVKQETIEICEIFDINPYELSSLGCLLMTSQKGYDIVNLFKNKGFDAKVIGHTTKTKAKILRIEDEVRYLDVPRMEESERIIYNGWDGKDNERKNLEHA